MSKLKKENYELRNERNELRKERDALSTQLKSEKDKIGKLSALAGDDEDLLKQLALARADARQQRREKKDLRAASNHGVKKKNSGGQKGKPVSKKKYNNDIVEQLTQMGVATKDECIIA
eukprot:511929_1